MRFGKIGGRNLVKEYWGLCFTAEEAGAKITMSYGTQVPEAEFRYSFDGVHWNHFEQGGGASGVTLESIGDKVYFAAGTSRNGALSVSSSQFRRFIFSKKIAASGDITSLIDADNPVSELTESAQLGFLFVHNSNITTPPQLPSTVISNMCYFEMFYNCTALRYAPDLPATTFKSSCYQLMFYNCSSMINGPHIGLTKISGACCNNMFANCSKLKNITVDFTSWQSGGITNWMNGVSATGTFRCPSSLGNDETISRGVNYCPEGWKVENT